MPALSVRDLVVRYGRAGKTPPAVDGVSFDVAPGETLGLVGESGSGKSTIGKAILGLQPAAAGQVLLHGADITRASLRQRRVAAIDLRVVFQDPYSSLNPAQTIGQTLIEPLRVLRVPKDAAASGAPPRRSPRSGCPPTRSSRYPAQFSGGQRQRIAIARALVCDPKVIVLDEPVSALDLSTQAQVLNLLADLRDSAQLALLFIAHDLGVVRFLAQRVVVLYRGQVMEAGPVEEVTQRPGHPYTIALTAAAPVPQPAEQAAAAPPARRSASATAGAAPPPPAGCPFATRCPLATDVCRTERPPLGSTVGDGRDGGRLPSRRPGRRARGRRASRPNAFVLLDNPFCSPTWRSLCCSSFPTASSGAWPAPATRTRAATPTATPGSPRTCRRRSSASRPAGRATAGSCGATDLDLAAGMSLNAYRFSVEWARVEPAEGEFSAAALGHYEAIADALPRARPRPGRDVQPLHLAALVRDARRAGSTRRRRRCSRGTATG